MTGRRYTAPGDGLAPRAGRNIPQWRNHRHEGLAVGSFGVLLLTVEFGGPVLLALAAFLICFYAVLVLALS